MSNEAFDIEEIQSFISEKNLKLPITLKLVDPVKLTESTLIETLTFANKVTAGDMEKLPVDSQVMGDFYPALSKMTGQSIILIKKLSFEDANNAMEVVNYFLMGSRKTGKQP
jgi:hypothetical protein